MTTALRVKDLPRRQLSALKRKAERLGLSTGDYLKQLIADDLELDRKAARTPLDQLAAPFRKALESASDDEIDRIVRNARTKSSSQRRQSA